MSTRDEPATIDFQDLLDSLADERLVDAEHAENTDLHFRDVIPRLRVIRRLAEALTVEYADEFLPQKIQELAASLHEVRKIVDEMVDFSLQRPNSIDTHRSLLQRAESQYNQWIANYRPLIRGAVSVGPLKAQLHASTADAQALLESLKASQERQTALVERAETLAAELAAGSLSSYYEAQAKNHKDASKRFLWAAGISAVVLAVAATILMLTIESTGQDDWPRFVRDLSVRLFVLGLGVFAINFMVRGYRANEHLRVINEHKANALKTYLLFQASVAEDPQAKALVTAELVKAVFASEQTGFLDHPPDTTVLDGQAPLISLLASQRKE